MIARLVTSIVIIKSLSAVEIDRYIDSGDWQGRPPPALTAMAQYYSSECAKASHNHEELDAQFKMVAEQPFNSLRPYTPSPPTHRHSPPLSSPHRAV